MITYMRDDLLKIYNHFGKEPQLSQWYEEAVELLDAIDNGNKSDVLNEMADNCVMAFQHYMTDAKLRAKVDEKIKRTLERIKSGYYEVS